MLKTVNAHFDHVIQFTVFFLIRYIEKMSYLGLLALINLQMQ